MNWGGAGYHAAVAALTAAALVWMRRSSRRAAASLPAEPAARAAVRHALGTKYGIVLVLAQIGPTLLLPVWDLVTGLRPVRDPPFLACFWWTIAGGAACFVILRDAFAEDDAGRARPWAALRFNLAATWGQMGPALVGATLLAVWQAHPFFVSNAPVVVVESEVFAAGYALGMVLGRQIVRGLVKIELLDAERSASLLAFAGVRRPTRVVVASAEGIPFINAFALSRFGRRTMLLGRELLTLLPEEELRAVARHELAHLDRRHILARTLAILAVAFGSPVLVFAVSRHINPDYAFFAALGLTSLAMAAFWGRQELQADADAGRDVAPGAMARALVRMHVARKIPLDVNHFTHPAVTKRIAALGLDPAAVIAEVNGPPAAAPASPES